MPVSERTSTKRAVVVAPHYLAAEAGCEILREGGNAIEATVAAAAALAVVYPHMNGLGGDGFWLLRTPSGLVTGIEGCGRSGALVDPDLYRSRGLDEIPSRGALAANTVAGTVASWARALELSSRIGGRMPLSRLLEPAILHAEHGFQVTENQHRHTRKNLDDLLSGPGFADQYLVDNQPPGTGSILRNERLSRTLRALARDGLKSFYVGALAEAIASDLKALGSPLNRADLHGCSSCQISPLSIKTRHGTVYNLPPPTQGMASLIILGIFDRLSSDRAEGFDHIHTLVEATKLAFSLRDRYVADPDFMANANAEEFLESARLDGLAAQLDTNRALPWSGGDGTGDTAWLGVADANGCVVSFIQSLYWEFGSGAVLPETGILWQNRGSSFILGTGKPRSLQPGRRPFHTLNPAMAILADGRVMSYGTMGGDGQPQTQAAVFTRHVCFGQPLDQAIYRPRWLLGRTWGESTLTLKLESRFPAILIEKLRAAGHDIEMCEAFDDRMGHAGAIVRYPDGTVDGASDPRCDGNAAVA